MNKRFILAGVLAGVVMFMWGAVSHMMIPWHDATYSSFRDEDLVAEVLMKEADQSGIYVMPMGESLNPDLTAEQKQAAKEEAWDKMAEGPIAFISLKKEGESGMATPMISDLVILILMSFVMLFLLQAVPQLTTMGKVLFVVVVGMVGMTLVHLEQWVWWNFSAVYVLVNIVDSAIRWAIGGFVMAKVGK